MTAKDRELPGASFWCAIGWHRWRWSLFAAGAAGAFWFRACGRCGIYKDVRASRPEREE